MPGLEDDGEDGQVVELAAVGVIIVGQSKVMDDEDDYFHQVKSQNENYEYI